MYRTPGAFACPYEAYRGLSAQTRRSPRARVRPATQPHTSVEPATLALVAGAYVEPSVAAEVRRLARRLGMEVAVPDVARVTLEGHHNVGPVQLRMTLYVRDAAIGWSTAQLTALAENARDSWRTNLAPALTPQVFLDKCVAQDLGTVPYGVPVELAVPAPNVGTRDGDNGPLFASGIVALRGDSGGTPRHSYVDTWPLSEGDTTNNYITNSEFARINDAYVAFMVGVTEGMGTAAQVIVSRTANGAPRAIGVSNTLSARILRLHLGRRVSRQY